MTKKFTIVTAARPPTTACAPGTDLFQTCTECAAPAQAGPYADLCGTEKCAVTCAGDACAAELGASRDRWNKYERQFVKYQEEKKGMKSQKKKGEALESRRAEAPLREELAAAKRELERLRADRSRERRSDDVAAPARPRPTTCANALMVVVFFLSGGVLGGGAGGALE